MATKEVVYPLRDDKQELQKQLGCMNGIFQIFDRRYLLGQRRHGHNQKRLPPGQSDDGEKKIRNALEQAKEKNPKVVKKEKQRVSAESSRNSFSSSSSSTAFSSLDCSKRVQTEQSSSCQSVISEPSSSPSLHKKKPDLFMQSPDIRDVVKDSMTREPRVISIKTIAKNERVAPPMKHIDSPRPFSDQKSIKYYANDRNLAKVRESKEMSRFSCDERESRYMSKSNMKVKELPRLSLDSRQSYISNSGIDPRRSLFKREIQGGGDKEPSTNQANEPKTNKQPSSRVVARLMGLEALSIDESATLKAKPCLSEESRSSRTEEEIKREVSKDSHVITRMPLERAPWKQEGSGRSSQKLPFKSKEASARAEPASHSIYGEVEKRLTEHEYITSGKDLRALKQILEAMQKTRRRLANIENASDNSIIDDRQIQKSHQPVSPRRREFLNMDTKPAKRTSDSRKDLVGRKRLIDPTPRDRRATGGPLSTSNNSGNVSPRMQRSKNNVNKPSIDGSLSDLSRTKKQPSTQHAKLGPTTRNPKAKSMDTVQDRVKLLGYNGETRNPSQHSDTVSFQSESNSLASHIDSDVTSTEWIQEVNSSFRQKENHKSNIVERLTQDKHTVEQPSPVSVLDAFYAEDTLSPVKKKSNAFRDYENLHFEETQDLAQINNLTNSTNLDHYSEFNNVKLENIKNLVHQIELLNCNAHDATIDHTATSPCESETGDHRYVTEILLASGFLKDLDLTTTIAQLNPTGGLINPQLFHVLEKTKRCIELTGDGYHRKNMRSKSKEKIRRKLVFDTVNDVLGHKLALIGPFGPRTKGIILNADKLLKELCSGIDSLQDNPERGIYDEDDEVISIINSDVNKRSQYWDEYYYEALPGLVLDIERLIFKDLIREVVNGQVTGLQDWPARHRRQLFPM